MKPNKDQEERDKGTALLLVFFFVIIFIVNLLEMGVKHLSH